MLLKFLFILLGTISLGIGIIGIFIPGLPTTPFILLTAGLYIRSSEKLYNLILKQKYFNAIIKNYQKYKGLPLKTKLYSIGFMWIMILVSMIIFLESLTGKLIIFGAGVIGTIVMGFMLRTIKEDE